MAKSAHIKLDDAGLRKLAAKLAAANLKGAKVGILTNAATQTPGFGMVELAATHEFGSPAQGIPARPWIGGTFRDAKAIKDFTELAQKVVKGIVLDRFSVDTGMQILGQWGATAVRDFVAAKKVTPDISDATKKKKKSTTPLVDTGRMINAVTYKVE